ncbi:MAG: hypothetical protein PHN42_06190 [Bacilli bacterium]|nr:hypothetical protein [Bacilli bacterium]
MKNTKLIKKKLFLILIILIILVFLIMVSFKSSYASYETESIINVDVNKAIYLFEEKQMSFNIDLDGIIPSDEPYIYSFSVSNYNEEQRSEVDLQYQISIITTTNLPLNYKLYRNEQYSLSSTNIISASDVVNDTDGSWYKKLTINDIYNMNYNIDKTDIYYLVVFFPKVYSDSTIYQGLVDNIQINIDSKQILE